MPAPVLQKVVFGYVSVDANDRTSQPHRHQVEPWLLLRLKLVLVRASKVLSMVSRLHKPPMVMEVGLNPIENRRKALVKFEIHFVLESFRIIEHIKVVHQALLIVDHIV